MKTRDEQIREAALIEYPKPTLIDLAVKHSDMREAFIEGAKWADQNPLEQKHEGLFLNELHKSQALESELAKYKEIVKTIREAFLKVAENEIWKCEDEAEFNELNKQINDVLKKFTW